MNFAFTSGRVDADLAWRRVKPFQGVDQARTRFLSVAECNKLLRACPTHFGNLAQAALLTGLRPGELVRLTVEQFKGTRLEVAAGKGKLRYVPLTRAGQAFFKKLAKGRQPGDLVLPNSEGGNWTPMQIARAMRAAVTAAKLPPAVFYDLRRSYGSLLANAGAGLSIIANALGHADTRMTKRHHAHLLDSVVAAELQDKLPTFRTRSSRKEAAGNGKSAVRRAKPAGMRAEENRLQATFVKALTTFRAPSATFSMTYEGRPNHKCRPSNFRLSSNEFVLRTSALKRKPLPAAFLSADPPAA